MGGGVEAVFGSTPAEPLGMFTAPLTLCAALWLSQQSAVVFLVCSVIDRLDDRHEYGVNSVRSGGMRPSKTEGQQSASLIQDRRMQLIAMSVHFWRKIVAREGKLGACCGYLQCIPLGVQQWRASISLALRMVGL